MDRSHVTSSRHFSRVLGSLVLAGAARCLINCAPNNLVSHEFKPRKQIFDYFFLLLYYWVHIDCIVNDSLLIIESFLSIQLDKAR